MSKFWSTMVKRADPYIPGEQVNRPNIIKLNTNENPYPPSPKVIEAIQEAVKEDLQLYPSPTVNHLRQTIGDYYGLSEKEVFVGNGSDEVLAFSFMAFFEPGATIRYPEITYSFYPVYAKLFGVQVEQITLNEDFTLPVEQFFGAEGGVILPNPNAPTSLYTPIEAIEQIVQNNPENVVIIDEAYVDFADVSAATLVRKYNNLLVIQTTSKSRSLAGLRVGFALGHEDLIAGLTRIKDSMNSYPIDRLAIAGATAAFEDRTYFEQMTAKIIATRERFSSQLEQLGFHVLPSKANFVFATHPEKDAEALYNQLKEANILVRYFDTAKIDQYLRITIGTEEQMDTLIEKLKALN